MTVDSLNRRRFIHALGALGVGAALPGVVLTAPDSESKLVVVILRGALDGLAAVPPYGDPDYAGLHRELAIAAPGSADGALRLDALFGLHPSLAFLHERYAAGEAVVFHAVASPYRERSHFDGQNVLENGLLSPIGSADGWLNRALAGTRAVAVSRNVPLILRGAVPVLSKSPFKTPDLDEDLVARLADLYSNDDWFSARLSEAVQGGRMQEGGDAGPPENRTAARRGSDRAGAAARMAAGLLRADGGPNVAVIEATGWDTHANQGGAQGMLATRLGGLDASLRALSEGLGAKWQRTAVLVVTEFGRTAAVNGTRGTDHGTGTCAFLVGGAVAGGRTHADWPGLTRTALLDARDLKPTLDLRSIFKGVLHQHLHVDSRTLDARVFPGSGGAPDLQGLMRA